MTQESLDRLMRNVLNVNAEYMRLASVKMTWMSKSNHCFIHRNKRCGRPLEPWPSGQRRQIQLLFVGLEFEF